MCVSHIDLSTYPRLLMQLLHPCELSACIRGKESVPRISWNVSTSKDSLTYHTSIPPDCCVVRDPHDPPVFSILALFTMEIHVGSQPAQPSFSPWNVGCAHLHACSMWSQPARASLSSWSVQKAEVTVYVALYGHSVSTDCLAVPEGCYAQWTWCMLIATCSRSAMHKETSAPSNTKRNTSPSAPAPEETEEGRSKDVNDVLNLQQSSDEDPSKSPSQCQHRCACLHKIAECTSCEKCKSEESEDPSHEDPSHDSEDPSHDSPQSPDPTEPTVLDLIERSSGDEQETELTKSTSTKSTQSTQISQSSQSQPKERPAVTGRESDRKLEQGAHRKSVSRNRKRIPKNSKREQTRREETPRSYTSKNLSLSRGRVLTLRRWAPERRKETPSFSPIPKEKTRDDFTRDSTKHTSGGDLVNLRQRQPSQPSPSNRRRRSIQSSSSSSHDFKSYEGRRKRSRRPDSKPETKKSRNPKINLLALHCWSAGRLPFAEAPR